MRGLYDFDMEGFKAIHIGMHREWLDAIFWLISSTGLGWLQAIVILCLLRWKGTRPYVAPLLLTLVVSGILICDTLKLLFARDRPSNLAIATPQESVYGANSFPSGHTTVAFALAFMVWLLTREGENAWIGKVALGWASLVGLSRVYRGVHWPTDVIGGICCGLFGSVFVYLMLRGLDRLPGVLPEDLSEEPVEPN